MICISNYNASSIPGFHREQLPRLQDFDGSDCTDIGLASAVSRL
jgi:hypothetical protein